MAQKKRLHSESTMTTNSLYYLNRRPLHPLPPPLNQYFNNRLPMHRLDVQLNSNHHHHTNYQHNNDRLPPQMHRFDVHLNNPLYHQLLPPHANLHMYTHAKYATH